MKQLVTGPVLGKMILDACGITEEGVRRVEGICEAGQVATVKVEFFVEMSAAENIVTAIKQFRMEAA